MSSGRSIVLLENDSAVRGLETLRAALPSSWTVEHRTDAGDADYLVVGAATADAAVAASGTQLRRAVLLEEKGDDANASEQRVDLIHKRVD